MISVQLLLLLCCRWEASIRYCSHSQNYPQILLCSKTKTPQKFIKVLVHFPVLIYLGEENTVFEITLKKKKTTIVILTRIKGRLESGNKEEKKPWSRSNLLAQSSAPSAESVFRCQLQHKGLLDSPNNFFSCGSNPFYPFVIHTRSQNDKPFNNADR